MSTVVITNSFNGLETLRPAPGGMKVDTTAVNQNIPQADAYDIPGSVAKLISYR